MTATDCERAQEEIDQLLNDPERRYAPIGSGHWPKLSQPPGLIQAISGRVRDQGTSVQPQCTLGGDPDRVGRDLQRVEGQLVDMRLPGGQVAKVRLRFRLQTGDRGCRQALFSHVVVSGVVKHVVSVSGAKQIEEVQSAL
jgi:hypothetical protein